MNLPTNLMELLCCPKCHGNLKEVDHPSGLHCKECRLVYLIENEIPNLIIEEAKPDDVLRI